MSVDNQSDLGRFLQQAGKGPALRAQLVPLSGQGLLRVTCNWLYSAVNCVPEDRSDFWWDFEKIGDGVYSIAPAASCISRKTYMSVRDDDNWYVQLQAPRSADWITAVGRDEFIGLSVFDMNFAKLTGFNGKLLRVENGRDNHGGHSGYRVRSIGEGDEDASTWFIATALSLQPGLQLAHYAPDPGAFAAKKAQLAAGVF
ncbi:MAG: hypothetical protein EOO16_09960 [Chitinophagaceae bacterium]|nr:MAG: hypothetical protein EOO16_09960 [Chitinophagaceae bacterium]